MRIRRQHLPADELRRELRSLESGAAEAATAQRRLLGALHDPTTVGRRNLLRMGGLAAVSGAVIVACGTDDTAGTVTVPPRLGTAPEPERLSEAIINDVVILRTAASLEYLAIDTYDFVLANFADLFTGAANPLIDVVKRFRDDHQRHGDAANDLIEELGGDRYECANERLFGLYVIPGVQLIAGSEAAASLLGVEAPSTAIPPSDDPLGDVLTLAWGLESLAGATYQGVVPALTVPELRRDAMTVAAEEARHATLLARVLAPEAIFSGEDTPIAAVPASFGQLGQVSFRIGAPNEVGNKTLVTLDSPSLNSLIYEDLGACPA
jgi:hypothetical protein